MDKKGQKKKRGTALIEKSPNCTISQSPDYDEPPHKERKICIGQRKILVDEGIAELVALLNKAGLKTLASCQGLKTRHWYKGDKKIKSSKDPAYLMIEMKNIADVQVNGKNFVLRWYPDGKQRAF